MRFGLKQRELFAVLSAIVLVWFILSCGGGGGGSSDSNSPATSSDINAQLEEYQPWEKFALVEDDWEEEIEITTEVIDQNLCTTRSIELTKNPEEIVTFGTAPDVLYLGSLIQGDSYLGGLGSLEELPIRQRAPLTIAIKVLTGGDITRVVDNPDAASVQQALSEIVAEAEDSGYETGGNTYYVYEEAYSSEQMALSLGVSYRFMGASAKTSMAHETSEETNTITAYFKQVMFEAYIVRPQTPAEFFSAEFTQDHLDKQTEDGNIGSDNLPVYVSRIQYGRILMYSMTSTASMDKLKMAAEAGYDGFGSLEFDVQNELKQIIEDQETEIKVVSIGGGDGDLRDCIVSGDISDYFKSDVSLTSAEPIAYAVVNLADGSLARVSETTEYEVKECSGSSWYTSENSWMKAVKKLNLQHLKLETTPENLALSNQGDQWDYPLTRNTGLGHLLTWSSDDPNFPFTFYLKAMYEAANALVYYDTSYGKIPFGTTASVYDRSISIGEAGSGHINDDFELGVENGVGDAPVFAIGIDVGDNGLDDSEFTEAFYEDGSSERNYHILPKSEGGIPMFIGIVSRKSLSKIKFDEDGGTDEIFVRDPCFGFLEVTD